MYFTDIHTHIIPSIDDGSTDIKETIEMLSIAYNGGTRAIAATPHMFLDLFGNNDLIAVQDRFDALMVALKAHRDQFNFLKDIKVSLGAENYASPEFLEALDQGHVLTLNDSRYLLIEFPPVLPFSQIQMVIQRIFLAGYTPIFAHPERCSAIQEEPVRMVNFWEQGCITQVNSDSLLGGGSSRSTKCAEELITEGLVDVIASDAHRVRWRPPDLGRIFRQLQDHYTQEDVRAWMCGNANSILIDKRLEENA